MIARRFTIRVEAAHRTGIPDWNEENHRLISPKPGFSNPTPEQTTVEVWGRGTATFETRKTGAAAGPQPVRLGNKQPTETSSGETQWER